MIDYTEVEGIALGESGGDDNGHDPDSVPHAEEGSVALDEKMAEMSEEYPTHELLPAEPVGQTVVSLNVSKAKAAFDAFNTELSNYLLEVSGLRVVSADDEADAAKTALELKQFKERIEKKRTELVAPGNEYVNLVNGLAKDVRTQLDVAIGEVSKKVIAYQNSLKEMARRRREEEERRYAEILKAKVDTEAAASGTVAVEVLPAKAAPVVRGVKVDGLGSAKVSTKIDFEISDFSKVPDQYKEIKRSFVMAALKNGVDIPGIRKIETEVMNLRKGR